MVNVYWVSGIGSSNYAQPNWSGVSTVADFKAAAQASTSQATDLTAFWSSHRVEG